MFQINCLNPISKVGLDRLTADYKVNDNMNDAAVSYTHLTLPTKRIV